MHKLNVTPSGVRACGTPLIVLLVLATGGAAAFAQTVAGSPDFNADGYDDLAIGVPGEDLAALNDAGAVNVIYGSSSRLIGSGNQFWTQDVASIVDQAEPDDHFGEALAWGDFNGDGFSDLAVGVPFEDVNGVVDAGAVNVLYGSLLGLTDVGNQLLHQDSDPGIPGTLQEGDRFGWSVTAGDFDGDGFPDLAVGVIGEVVISRPADGSKPLDNAGAVNVFYGSGAGLTSGSGAGVTSVDAQLWTQESPDVKDFAEAEDMFGWSLSAGDFNGDGFDDMVVGAPWEDGSFGNSGIVHMIPGSATGLTGLGSVYYLQGQGGIPDVNCPDPSKLETCQELSDIFGWAVSAGNFNGDAYDDMVIGVPGEDLNGVVNAGQVHVLYGSSTGPIKRGSQLWNQDRPGVVDQVEFSDSLGYSLASGDFNGDGFDDLSMGVPGERLENADASLNVKNAGVVHVLYGSASRLTANADKVWHQDIPGIRDVAETADAFGAAQATGDFNGDGYSDLAVGVPREDVGTATDAGAANVLYGSASGIASLNNQFWQQDVSSIQDDPEAGDGFGKALPSH